MRHSLHLRGALSRREFPNDSLGSSRKIRVSVAAACAACASAPQGRCQRPFTPNGNAQAMPTGRRRSFTLCCNKRRPARSPSPARGIVGRSRAKSLTPCGRTCPRSSGPRAMAFTAGNTSARRSSSAANQTSSGLDTLPPSAARRTVWSRRSLDDHRDPHPHTLRCASGSVEQSRCEGVSAARGS
jgi:hypothetical protein